MFSINGIAMQRALSDSYRHALGCPSILGSRSLAVAKNHRDFKTEPTP